MSVGSNDGDPRARSLAPEDPSPLNETATLRADTPTDPFSEPKIAAFLNALVEAIEGEVDATTGTCARFSTGAGLYRIPPLALVFPVSVSDVLAALDLARKYKTPMASRGGDTSCVGNAIGPGIVLDFTRHLNKVMSIDPQARTAVVESDCIEASLQEAAAPFDPRFGPDPLSRDHASIGDMVGNSACGPYATAWGHTADSIVTLDCVNGLGRRFTTRLEHNSSLPGVPDLAELIDSNLGIIRTELGTFGHQMSGYSLGHLAPEKHRDLATMLVSTGGTLVTVLQITIRLIDLPKAPVLVTLGHPNMVAAADDVPTVLEHHPLVVEGLDSRLVGVVRRHSGPDTVPELPSGQNWMLRRVGGTGLEDSLTRTRALVASTHTDTTAVYPPGADVLRLWRIRADGTGLGGQAPFNPDTGEGNEQAWPGPENAAVPPAQLGAYLHDFTALMKESDIDGLLYGRFGNGCVHVRLDMPLETDKEVAHLRRSLERTTQYCASHAGSVSGEYGGGRARSEFLRFIYSPVMLSLFAQVKGLFGPGNLLNPGVLTTPMSVPRAAVQAGTTRPGTKLGADVEDVNPQPGVDLLNHFLRRPASRRPHADGDFALREDHEGFATAVHRYAGVGKCRAGVFGAFMCPSWKATKDEKNVTRRRACTLQDTANGQLIASIDSPEVLEALGLCLACKACSSDCPAGIDMAKYRSEIFFRRYRGRLCPLSHYTLGQLPRWARLSISILGATALANALLSVDTLRRLVSSFIGLDSRRPMPTLQSGTFLRWARARGLSSSSPSTQEVSTAPTQASVASASQGGQASTSSPEKSIRGAGGPHDPGGQRYVLAWADSFSQTLGDMGTRSIVELLEADGSAVIVAPSVCCGLTWITAGQLSGTKKRLSALLNVLTPFAANGIPILGVEPSCTAVLRDDVLNSLPEDPRSSLLARDTFTLSELLTTMPNEDLSLPDLSGVEIVAQPHCHHYSVTGWSADRALLDRLGTAATQLSDRCDLAGNFGMGKGHYEVSVKVAEKSLSSTLAEHPEAVYLADRFSCRAQAAQLAERDDMYLATLLLHGGKTQPGR